MDPLRLSPHVQVIADLFIFMEYSKARGKHDGRFTQIRLWVQFVLGKLACFVLGIDAFLFKVRIAYRTEKDSGRGAKGAKGTLKTPKNRGVQQPSSGF